MQVAARILLTCEPSVDSFHAKSYSEVPPEHKSKYAAWETPEPVFWTKHGYVVVRVDERGLGQSPGVLDTMSRGTSECFFHVVEWAAAQSWSSGKVGLLGISYYAGMNLLPDALCYQCIALIICISRRRLIQLDTHRKPMARSCASTERVGGHHPMGRNVGLL